MTASAVITGLGVTAPTGMGHEPYWAATLAGRNGISRITRFTPDRYSVQLAGEIRGFDAAKCVPSRLIPQTDRWTHLGLAAADMALADAGAERAGFSEYEMAVVTASSSGGTEFGQREIEKLWSIGPQRVGAYQSIAWFYAATTGQISIRHGMRGPCGVICAEQAGGLDALGQARRMLQHGARLVVTGGTDASLCPYGLVAQLSNRMLSTQADPCRAYAPFDAGACGYVPAEGGAIIITETLDSAHARGARIYAEITGYAATFDPKPGSGRPPGLRRAIELSLADAGVPASGIDVVFADALGVPVRDLQEAQAITAVFGPSGVPVTAPKTMTGRMYAGGAPLDVAAAALALRDQVIPPTITVREVAPGCVIDLVRSPRQAALRRALVVARGYGGFNSALVIEKT
jgi:minimal PKS chain-length factor (CLF/KS beta)